MIDAGINPNFGVQAGTPVSVATLPDWTYVDPACPELRSFDWDHEGFGNSRTSGSAMDIGFDEFQMFIMAGSYANDSNSHNVSGFLNPTPEAGRPGRIMLFPALSIGANQVSVNGVYGAVTQPSATGALLPAWTTPPRTTAVSNPLLPPGFRIRYISFSNNTTSTNPPMVTTMPWLSPVQGPPNVTYTVPWNTPQGQVFFSTMLVPDQEMSTGYFGAQAVIHGGDPIGSPLLWSNLQYEYR